MFIPSVSTLGAASTTGIIATSSTLTKHGDFSLVKFQGLGNEPVSLRIRKRGCFVETRPIYTSKQTQGLNNNNSILLVFLSFTKFQWQILLDHCRSKHICRTWKIGDFFVGTFGSGNSGRWYRDSTSCTTAASFTVGNLQLLQFSV